MRIFISAGEPSGDLHAANLVRSIRKLRPDVEFKGFGGEHLQSVGVPLLYPLVELAVMWFGRVLINLHKFFRLAWQAEAVFRDEKPDAVVLIDYPGFHWALAKRAKRYGVSVYYFVPPQIWAWGGWRISKIRRWFDLVLCSLPFEPAWYRARGVDYAEYVGHPYFDELTERTLDEDFLAEQRTQAGRLVAILPGSRTQEVTRNLPIMLKAAVELAKDRPGVRFAIACLRPRHAELARAMIAGLESPIRVEVHAGKTPELIRLADVAWAVSGSVGLELMVEALPTVVLYKVNRFDLWVARWFIKSRYISLVNLLADAEVFPEYLTPFDVSPELANWAGRWLDDPQERAKAVEAIEALRARVAVPGASDRAAARILEEIAKSSVSARAIPAPHGSLSTARAGKID